MEKLIISAVSIGLVVICLKFIFANYKKGERTYLTEGMCIGMCLGVLIFRPSNFNLDLGMSLGMLVGETIGNLIKKK